MGGSSATPGDLSRKFDKPTKQQTYIERRQRFLLLRQYCLEIEYCLQHWSAAEKFNRSETQRLLGLMDTTISRETDPRRQASFTPLRQHCQLLRDAIQNYGGGAERTLTHYYRLYEAYRMSYHLERQLQREGN